MTLLIISPDYASHLLPLATLGTAWRDVNVDIGFIGDSIAIRNVAATSGDRGSARSQLSGFIGVRDRADPTFDLRLTADNFNAIHKQRVADLDLSGFQSGTFELEWPPRSGRRQAFPEVDQIRYWPSNEARCRILAGQRPLIEEALTRLG